MKIYLVVIFTFIFLGTSLKAQSNETENGGIIYGLNHAFIISAPKGWILDNESGVSSGLHAVFYPIGSNWENGLVVMYANGFAKPQEGDRSLKGFIDADIAHFKENNSGIQVKIEEDKITGDSKKASIRLFTGDKGGNFEKVAYIEEESSIITLVLSAKSSELFTKSQTAFNQLISNYKYLTDKVNTEEGGKKKHNN